MAGGQPAGLFGDYGTVVYLSESGPKGPLACRQWRESYEEHPRGSEVGELPTTRRLNRPDNLLACLVPRGGSSLYRPNNYAYEITREKGQREKMTGRKYASMKYATPR